MSCEAKTACIASDYCFWLKYDPSIHTIAISSEKVVLSETEKQTPFEQLKTNI